MGESLTRKELDALFLDVGSTDDQTRMNAFNRLLSLTENEVDWFEDKADEIAGKLTHENSYQRSIGIKLLCNLAKSDKTDRVSTLLPEILTHTQDPKFVTSRQCIQSIWKIAIAKPANRKQIVDHLERQYLSCETEKHYNLIRQDILQSLHNIYRANRDERLKGEILDLFAQEKDPKYRRSYEKILGD